MKLKVGSSQKGSTKAVARSGTITMSPELMLLNPTDEPSKPIPRSIRLGVEAVRRQRDVVPATPKVAELEVDLLDGMLVDERDGLVQIAEHHHLPPFPRIDAGWVCYQIHKHTPRQELPLLQTGCGTLAPRSQTETGEAP